jgi:hypothetical protein
VLYLLIGDSKELAKYIYDKLTSKVASLGSKHVHPDSVTLEVDLGKRPKKEEQRLFISQVMLNSAVPLGAYTGALAVDRLRMSTPT